MWPIKQNAILFLKFFDKTITMTTIMFAVMTTTARKYSKYRVLSMTSKHASRHAFLSFDKGVSGNSQVMFPEQTPLNKINLDNISSNIYWDCAGKYWQGKSGLSLSLLALTRSRRQCLHFVLIETKTSLCNFVFLSKRFGTIYFVFPSRLSSFSLGVSFHRSPYHDLRLLNRMLLQKEKN